MEGDKISLFFQASSEISWTVAARVVGLSRQLRHEQNHGVIRLVSPCFPVVYGGIPPKLGPKGSDPSGALFYLQESVRAHRSQLAEFVCRQCFAVGIYVVTPRFQHLS